MDPNACLERLRNAWLDGDDDEQKQAATDLYLWIKKGGFIPTPTESQLSCLLHIAAFETFNETV